MKIDFFVTPCKEQKRTDSRIGICDDQDYTKAYTTIDNNDKWIAIIKNDKNRVDIQAEIVIK